MCGDARPVASPVLAAAIKSLWRASDNCTPRAACDATPGNAQSGRGLISPRTLFIFRKPMATTPETPEPAEDVTPYAPAPTVAHVSVLRRSNAIVVLALIAIVVFLHWAQAVLIPITLSVFLTYALKPIVNWLERKAKLPKAIGAAVTLDRKSTRLNSSHLGISYAVFCLKKKNEIGRTYEAASALVGPIRPAF